MAHSIKLLFITCVLQSDAVSFRRQLEHVAQAQAESDGHFANRRTFYQYDPREVSKIIGVPARASHLPRAENILPGHTLNRPGLGMLKSAIKFPHKDLEDGSGVYGHYENLGETYGPNERILYSGFRRSPSDYIMVLPSEKNKQPSFKLRSVVLDLEKKERAKRKIQKILQWVNMLSKGRVEVIYNDKDGDDLNDNGKVKKELSYYMTNDKKLYNPRHQMLSTDYNRLKPTLRSNKEVEHKENILESSDSESSEGSDSEGGDSNSTNSAFWATKDLYDHVKLPRDAITMFDLVPEWKPKMEQAREWWFFNQEDFKPLKEK